MSIDSIYIYGVLEHVPFPRVSIRQYSGDYIYIIIFRNVLLISCTYVFNREFKLGVYREK